MSNVIRRLATSFKRQAPKTKVAILGASSGTGQSLSLLLKKSPFVNQLALYDTTGVIGVTTDLSHINTRPTVKGFSGKESLAACLSGVEVVALVGGVTLGPGRSNDAVLDSNGSMVAEFALACGEFCPDAMICVLIEPINSTVPIVAEMLKRSNAYNPKHLFGVTTLDVVRANTFIAACKGMEPCNISVPVIGGHSGVTIVPVISKCVPEMKFASSSERAALVRRIQEGASEIASADGSGALAAAYAAHRFITSLLNALEGKEGVVECSYAESNAWDCDFFSSPLLLGTDGLDSSLPVSQVYHHEEKLLREAIPVLQEHIMKGIKFAEKFDSVH